jgi:hypothetical protein
MESGEEQGDGWSDMLVCVMCSFTYVASGEICQFWFSCAHLVKIRNAPPEVNPIADLELS